MQRTSGAAPSGGSVAASSAPAVGLTDVELALLSQVEMHLSVLGVSRSRANVVAAIQSLPADPERIVDHLTSEKYTEIDEIDEIGDDEEEDDDVQMEDKQQGGAPSAPSSSSAVPSSVLPSASDEEESSLRAALALSLQDEAAVRAARDAPLTHENNSTSANSASSSPATHSTTPARSRSRTSADKDADMLPLPDSVHAEGMASVASLLRSEKAKDYKPPGLRHDNPLAIRPRGPQHAASSILPATAYYASNSHDGKAAQRAKQVTVHNTAAGAAGLTAPPVVSRPKETAAGFFSLIADQKDQTREIAATSFEDTGVRRVYEAAADSEMKDANHLSNMLASRTAFTNSHASGGAASIKKTPTPPPNTIAPSAPTSAKHADGRQKSKKKRPHSSIGSGASTAAAAAVSSSVAGLSAAYFPATPSSSSWTPAERLEHDKRQEAERARLIRAAQLAKEQDQMKRMKAAAARAAAAAAATAAAAAAAAAATPPTTTASNTSDQQTKAKKAKADASNHSSATSQSTGDKKRKHDDGAAPAAADTAASKTNSSHAASTHTLAVDTDHASTDSTKRARAASPTPAPTPAKISVPVPVVAPVATPAAASSTPLVPPIIPAPSRSPITPSPVLPLQSSSPFPTAATRSPATAPARTPSIPLISMTSPPPMKLESFSDIPPLEAPPPIYADDDDECRIVNVSHSQSDADAFLAEQEAAAVVASKGQTGADDHDADDDEDDDESDEDAELDSDESGDADESDAPAGGRAKSVEVVDLESDESKHTPVKLANGFRQVSAATGSVMLEVVDTSDDDSAKPPSRAASNTAPPPARSSSVHTHRPVPAFVAAAATSTPPKAAAASVAIPATTNLPASVTHRTKSGRAVQLSLTPFCPILSQDDESFPADRPVTALATLRVFAPAKGDYLRARQPIIFDELLSLDQEMASSSLTGDAFDRLCSRLEKRTDALNKESDRIEDEMEQRKSAAKAWKRRRREYKEWWAATEDVEEGADEATEAATNEPEAAEPHAQEAKEDEEEHGNAYADEDLSDGASDSDSLSSDSDDISESEGESEPAEDAAAAAAAAEDAPLPSFQGHRHLENSMVKLETEWTKRATGGTYDKAEATRRFNRVTREANARFTTPAQDDDSDEGDGAPGDNGDVETVAASSVSAHSNAPSVWTMHPAPAPFPAHTAAAAAPAMASASSALPSPSVISPLSASVHTPVVRRKVVSASPISSTALSTPTSTTAFTPRAVPTNATGSAASPRLASIASPRLASVASPRLASVASPSSSLLNPSVASLAGMRPAPRSNGMPRLVPVTKPTPAHAASIAALTERAPKPARNPKDDIIDLCDD